MNRQTANFKVFRLASDTHKKISEFFNEHVAINITDHLFIADLEWSDCLAETLVASSEEEVSLSIRVSESLAQRVQEIEPPFEKLSNENIGPFAIIAEEVSHFHCLCIAATNRVPISRWDLELQSEFDKFIVAACLMEDQTGKAHFKHLARLLFDSTAIYSSKYTATYSQTENLAAQWWWSRLGQANYPSSLKVVDIEILQKIRILQGQAKIDYIRNTTLSRGSQRTA
ncbi:MAG: hypothetical protein NTV34_02600 [Proteobacteria bacterium]|nr:hypothetical protein [Pseudomonadota bacterium]